MMPPPFMRVHDARLLLLRYMPLLIL